MKHLSPRRAASGAVLAVALTAPWAMPAQAQSTPAPAASPAAATATPGPQQFTLVNGMTLIVQPDRRSPTAVQMVWVRVGPWTRSTAPPVWHMRSNT
jgi:zinc protease